VEAETGMNGDRVRARTAAEVLRRIDGATADRLADYANADAQAVERRLQELDREWDTDRIIEVEASAMALTGLVIGTFFRRSFLAIPAVVGGAVFLHAMTGFYPLLPLFRRLGVRSPREIERERYALKALRGDFGEARQHGSSESVTAAVPPPTDSVPRLREEAR
jgi:hypothetical protein